MAERNRKLRASRIIRQRARELRGEQTHAEKLLWDRLRGRQLEGLKFRRQHTIGRFVADFYCAQAGLVVELDGDVHSGREAYDAERTEILEANDYCVIRFSNAEIERNMEGVLEQIRMAAIERS